MGFRRVNPITGLFRFAARKQVRKILPEKEIKRHVLITWNSGSGKSERLKTLVQVLQLGSERKRDAGLVLIDPHGDCADSVRKFYHNFNKNRIAYIDPFLKEGMTPTINPFELQHTDEQTIELATSQLVDVFQELIPDALLSNQMRALLVPCISTLLRCHDASLEDLQNFLRPGKNEEWISKGQHSPIHSHRKFFMEDFHNPIYRATKQSILVKVQSLLNSRIFYNLTTWLSTIRLDRLLNDWKIVIFNLAKGRMGDEPSQAYGRFIIAQLQYLAQARVAIAPQFRKPRYLLIDEFHNYTTRSLGTILKETRKFGLHLIMATQTLGEIASARLRGTILSNSGVKIIGTNGLNTQKTLRDRTGIPLKTMETLKKYQFVIKAGERAPIVKRTPGILTRAKSLYMNQREVRAFNKRMVEDTGYYKPTLPVHPREDRIDDFPRDWKEQLLQDYSPKPKYAL